MKKRCPAVFAFLMAISSGWTAEVSVFVSPNDIESAEGSGIIGITPQHIFTETFNEIPIGQAHGYYSSVIGVNYTSEGGGNIQPGGQYGGYDGGNHLGIGASGSTMLSLATPAQYFGLYLTAADDYNSIQIFIGETLLLSFDSAMLTEILPHTTGTVVTAINGDQYFTSNYYGQPVSELNAGEVYAYLHFVTFGDVKFDRIELSQGDALTF